MQKLKFLILLILISSSIECFKLIKKGKLKKGKKLAKGKKHKKSIKKHKRTKVHKSRALVDAGMFQGKTTLSLIVVLLYLYLIFNMEQPYMLFFMAPFFFQAIAGAFNTTARKLKQSRELIDLHSLLSLGSLFSGIGDKASEPKSDDFRQLFKNISPDQIQSLVADVSNFMSHQKINKKGNQKKQIVNLASEYATQKLGIKDKNLKSTLNKMTSQLMKNKDSVLEILSKII